MQLILASQSPRRQELLGLITPDFSVCPADIDEGLRPGADLVEEVARLAAGKARAVADLHPQAAVIGSDTLVVLDGQALGKPADAQDACRMLRLLSGRTHEVMTGLALYVPGQGMLTDTVVHPRALCRSVRRGDRVLRRLGRTHGQGGRIRYPGYRRTVHPGY